MKLINKIKKLLPDAELKEFWEISDGEYTYEPQVEFNSHYIEIVYKKSLYQTKVFTGMKKQLKPNVYVINKTAGYKGIIKYAQQLTHTHLPIVYPNLRKNTSIIFSSSNEEKNLSYTDTAFLEFLHSSGKTFIKKILKYVFIVLWLILCFIVIEKIGNVLGIEPNNKYDR